MKQNALSPELLYQNGQLAVKKNKTECDNTKADTVTMTKSRLTITAWYLKNVHDLTQNKTP